MADITLSELRNLIDIHNEELVQIGKLRDAMRTKTYRLDFDGKKTLETYDYPETIDAVMDRYEKTAHIISELKTLLIETNCKEQVDGEISIQKAILLAAEYKGLADIYSRLAVINPSKDSTSETVSINGKYADVSFYRIVEPSLNIVNASKKAVEYKQKRASLNDKIDKANNRVKVTIKDEYLK